ncbi:MAG: TonB-dependent receptor plug domain-containing protein [Planctomycetota bacterium]|jgi:outer membrane receptor protein involved in Fe transport
MGRFKDLIRALSVGFAVVLVFLAVSGTALGGEKGVAPKKPPPKGAPKAQPKKGAEPAKKGDPAKGAPEGKKEKPAEVELEPVVVTTPTRTAVRPLKLSRFVTFIGEEEFERMGATVAVNALGSKIGTWVEHRTGSTGDAVVRGLSGGNLLTLVDGCSLSTFWGEGGFAGDDMYGKVDPESLERIEVLRGPGSVLYGSQALGAVINFITKSCPLDFTDGTFRYGGRSKFLFTSGNSGFTFRNEAYAAVKDFRVIAGHTYRDLGDVRAGGGVGRQKPTSSEESNLDVKADFKLADNQTLTIAHQNVQRDPTHRYYRPTQNNRNLRRGYLFRYKADKLSKTVADVDLKLFHQYKEDLRRWFPPDPNQRGKATTKTYQAEAQTTFKAEAMGKHAITAGAVYHYDWGESPDDEQFTMYRDSWAVGPPGARMDGPLTHWQNFGLFLQDEFKPAFAKDRVRITAAVRYDYFLFETDPFDPAYYPAEYNANPGAFASLAEAQAADDFKFEDHILTGGIGWNIALTDWLSIAESVTVGYRQWPPKFGVTQHGNGLYVPSKEAANIYSYNIESGLKWDHKNVKGEMVFYYNWWDGFVEWHPTTYLGQDWYDWNNNSVEDANEKVFARSASGQAYVLGFEAETTFHLKDLLGKKGFWDGLSLSLGFMYNYGKDLTSRHTDNPNTDVDDDWTYDPVRHTHPLRGLFEIKWENPGKEDLWLSFKGDFVDRFTRIPYSRMKGVTSGSDVGYYRDPQDSSKGLLRTDGLPGYAVYSLMAGWKPTKNIGLTFGAENIFDRRYRRAHSRADEMGLNLILGVDIKFN